MKYNAKIVLEVISMDMKTMLKKLFARYAILGARNASLRGCYEPSVPEKLAKKISLTPVDSKQAKNK